MINSKLKNVFSWSFALVILISGFSISSTSSAAESANCDAHTSYTGPGGPGTPTPVADWFYTDCNVFVHSQVWITSIDRLAVDLYVSGQRQECWDTTTEHSFTTEFTPASDDEAYPNWVGGWIEHDFTVGVASPKKVFPFGTLLWHYIPLNGNGLFEVRSTAGVWIEHIPVAPEKNSTLTDAEPTPCT